MTLLGWSFWKFRAHSFRGEQFYGSLRQTSGGESFMPEAKLLPPLLCIASRWEFSSAFCLFTLLLIAPTGSNDRLKALRVLKRI
ncbi:hypothetical protein VTN77DRAFT_2487 [Rasamsonia byssochlamydoides]|uniref:uncharacterized protein n=1 Tax=Rasamsonia byssochlamydoides TaxID=89139 RepID=UPI003743E79E